MSDIYIACMGGSGARVANALLNVIAAGMFDEYPTINLLIADPDE